MLNTNISQFTDRLQLKRGMVFGILIVAALFAFELFNYSTTDFALTDLLGELTFLGIRWATILSIAFCGIDFAGIARLFTPEQGSDEPAEVWYLFGAWMLAAVMNAMLTWWGVSIALINHDTLGNAVVAQETLLKVVPIFVAIMVWLIRVLIIGTISMAGDRLFSQAKFKQPRTSRKTAQVSSNQTNNHQTQYRNIRPLSNTSSSTIQRSLRSSSYIPAPKPDPDYTTESEDKTVEPTYHPVSFSGRENNNPRQTRY
jgi:hypothetical protein